MSRKDSGNDWGGAHNYMPDKCKNRGPGRLARLETEPLTKNQCPHGRGAHAPWANTFDPALFGHAPREDAIRTRIFMRLPRNRFFLRNHPWF